MLYWPYHLLKVMQRWNEIWNTTYWRSGLAADLGPFFLFLFSGLASALCLCQRPSAQSHLPSEQLFWTARLTALIFHRGALVLGWSVISETILDPGCQVNSLPFLGWDDAILTWFLQATLIFWVFKTSNVVLPFGGDRDNLVVHPPPPAPTFIKGQADGRLIVNGLVVLLLVMPHPISGAYWILFGYDRQMNSWFLLNVKLLALSH